jgi:hypothetical protein
MKKASPKSRTLTLWGRTLHRGPATSADQWWMEKNEVLGEPTVRANLCLALPSVPTWSVEILGKNNVFARCTGSTLEGCVDHLNATGLPAKWFKKKRVAP